MSPSTRESDWKEHFPTYRFKKRDIALQEYDFATKTLEAEERLFLNAVNISVIVSAALASFVLGSLEKLSTAFVPLVPQKAVYTVILLLTCVFTIVALRYFADRQKAVVFAARKVIVLRRMLGMTYGSLQLVLPNWRIEGADEPFAIRLFPGWGTYVMYPCFAVAGISSAMSFFVLAALIGNATTQWKYLPLSPLALLTVTASAWFMMLCWVYRKALFEIHERTELIITRICAKIFRLNLVTNFEYVIYRAILAKHELHRLRIDLSVVKNVLIHVEDKEFYDHCGVSWKGLARLALSALDLRPRSGGSTITQQLVRTLFIQDHGKLFRRKFTEIMLALWFDKVSTKMDQLEIYLASVRYETGVLGLAAAMKHFFGTIRKSLSPAEAFFVIERIANVRSSLLVERIDQMARRAVAAGLLCSKDLDQVLGLYADAVTRGLVQDPTGSGIDRLQRAWRSVGEADVTLVTESP